MSNNTTKPPPPRLSLSAFLRASHDALRTAASDQNTHVTLVPGNESADLDSLASSLLLAYILTFSPPGPPTAATDVTPGGKRNHLTIPLVNIPRADVRLRPEFTAALRHAGVTPASSTSSPDLGPTLVTTDDIPFPPTRGDGTLLASSSRPRNPKKRMMEDPPSEPTPSLPPDRVSILLVDHNAPTGRLSSTYGRDPFAASAGAIDHHQDEHWVPTSASPRLLGTCGSCTSLVVAHVRDRWDALPPPPPEGGAASSPAAAWDAQLARLALAAVLVDTSCLGNADKTRAEDTEAVAYLEGKVAAAAEGDRREGVGRYDREAFFREMDAASRDLDGLTVAEVLRKDYKSWGVDGPRGQVTLGMSTVPGDVAFLVEKARGAAGGAEVGAPAAASGFLDEVRSFAAERKLGVHAVMTISTDGEGVFRRELVLWGFGAAGAAAARRFAEGEGRELGLEKLNGENEKMDGESGAEDGEETWWRRAWRQKETRYSRKQVAPMLRRALEEAVAETGTGAS